MLNDKPNVYQFLVKAMTNNLPLRGVRLNNYSDGRGIMTIKTYALDLPWNIRLHVDCKPGAFAYAVTLNAKELRSLFINVYISKIRLAHDGYVNLDLYESNLQH